MSQGYKLKFNQMRENNPSQREAPDAGTKEVEAYYPEESGARTLCLVWTDGKRIGLSYHYMVSAEYLPQESTITLSFTAQIFVLKGVNLEGLFYDILRQAVRQITCTDERYNLMGDEDRFAVNEITVMPQQ